MEKLSVKDLRTLKKEFLSKWAKYAIKQSEQTGGQIDFKVDGKTYTLKYGLLYKLCYRNTRKLECLSKLW